MSQSNERVRVGIVGLGRSGWGIHADAIRKMPDRFKVVAVHDVWAERMNESAKALEARAHGSLEGLLGDGDVELVVVASPNKFHFPHALAALGAGKHVLCEKPFTTAVAEVDQLIAAAQKNGRVLQPFQQRRYEHDFKEVKRVIESGVLGRVQFVRSCWHSFKRRWDWQTMQSMSGGELFNNMPHPIDQALEIFGEGAEPDVWCERKKCLTSGDAEDHVKVILSGEGRPTIEIEISSIFAYGGERWLVCGTAGGLHGTGEALEWKWVDWSTMPERPLETKSTPDRSYNSEKLNWQTGSWKMAGAADAGPGAAPAAAPVLDLYANLFGTVRHGQAQLVTPQQARRRVAVLERCAKMAPVKR